jgi:hypothetical protein
MSFCRKVQIFLSTQTVMKIIVLLVAAIALVNAATYREEFEHIAGEVNSRSSSSW